MTSLSLRPSLLEQGYELCELCPRRCGVDRSSGKRGVCGQTSQLRIARAALHFWEEPPISGEAGSGAIFFSGCPLRCVFCQNHEISTGGFGKDISVERLSEIMLELQDQGALNINLVTALHFAPHLCEAIDRARSKGLRLPIVCNTSGYERHEIIHELEDYIDVWLCDFKYASPKLAGELSQARDYPETAYQALGEMVEQLRRAGGRHCNSEGAMQRGIIVRHLVLPERIADSLNVLDLIWEIGHNELDLSVMNQYTTNEQCRTRSDGLERTLSKPEYEEVLDYADELGFTQLWWQESGTVSESFIPPFDLTGVDQSDIKAVN
ncbi:MAG: radical SAM protein [Atopobiaceae bacterium]|nr:radical SAM protein [Atopobiaceae bacterium]